MSPAKARSARPMAAIAGFALACMTWAASAADEAGPIAQGRALFSQTATPACALCHTLKDADAEGAVGPNLDELRPDAARVAKALRNGLGQMPAYQDKLSAAQIAALALYVSRASGAAR